MEFKKLVLLIVIGGLGGMLFVIINLIGGNDDRILLSNLSSSERNLSPSPMVTENLSSSTMTKTKTKVTENNGNDDKKEPEPTPRATKEPIPLKTTTPTPKATSTPTPTPKITPTPTPQPTPSPTPTPTPTPIITPTPTPTPEPQPTPTPEPNDDNIKVVINEIAWMGTHHSSNDEWIEIYNAGSSEIDLAGWILTASDGTPSINIESAVQKAANETEMAKTTIIPPGGYFLLERTDDTTISDISADGIYTGALVTACEVLGLYDNNGDLQDNVGCFENGWFAGDNTEKLSMERISPDSDGLDNLSWKSNDSSRNGLDAEGGQINGTPRHSNS